MPAPNDATITEREPVLVIVGSAVALLNVVLVAVVAFFTLEPGQTAALFAIPNALGAFAAALLARGRVAPWEPIDLPPHAIDQGYDPHDATPRGL